MMARPYRERINNKSCPAVVVALTLSLIVLVGLGSCGSGASSPSAPPPPPSTPTPQGVWRVVAVSNVQSDGVFPLPLGSRFSISESALEWVSIGSSGPRWYADLPTRIAAWQHPFDYYDNDFAAFPVNFGYGWNQLEHGQEGTALTESFYELDHGENSLTLRYTFGLWENFARTAFLMCRYELERVPGELLHEEEPEMESDVAITLFGW